MLQQFASKAQQCTDVKAVFGRSAYNGMRCVQLLEL